MNEEISDFDELNEAVKGNGDLLTIRVRELRDIHGAERLGSIVRENISKELEARGIGHFPEELPANQYEFVRLFKKGTPVGQLIGAVTCLDGDENEVAASEALVKERAASESQKVLDKIRELLEVAG